MKKYMVSVWIENEIGRVDVDFQMHLEFDFGHA